jgi:hypothetical protein
MKQDDSLWAWGYNWNGALGTGSFDNPLRQPTKIESAVPWRTNSAIRILTNSPSPSSLSIPRVPSGGSFVLTATSLDRVPIGSIEWFVNGKSIGSASATPWSATADVPTLGSAEASRRLQVEAYVKDASGVLIDIVSRPLDIVMDPTGVSGE